MPLINRYHQSQPASLGARARGAGPAGLGRGSFGRVGGDTGTSVATICTDVPPGPASAALPQVGRGVWCGAGARSSAACARVRRSFTACGRAGSHRLCCTPRACTTTTPPCARPSWRFSRTTVSSGEAGGSSAAATARGVDAEPRRLEGGAVARAFRCACKDAGSDP